MTKAFDNSKLFTLLRFPPLWLTAPYPRRRSTAVDDKNVICLAWLAGRGDQ